MLFVCKDAASVNAFLARFNAMFSTSKAIFTVCGVKEEERLIMHALITEHTPHCFLSLSRKLSTDVSDFSLLNCEFHEQLLCACVRKAQQV